MAEQVINQPPNHFHKRFFGRSFVDKIHWMRLSNVLREVKQWDRVLDLGCGSGLTSYLCGIKECIVIGYDIRKECIQYARKTCKNGKFYVGDITIKDFSLLKIDTVLLNDVIEHFPKEKLCYLFTHLPRTVTKIVITVPSLLELFIEKTFYMKYKKWKNPSIKFDNEDMHRWVKASEIRKVFSSEWNIRRGFWCYGLIQYVILER